jgi:rhodanese-related sulfurtransferase
VVDEQMRSSDPAIFAVGDVVEVTEYVTKTPAQIALAGPANKQARIAANAICGIPSSYKGTQGSAIIKVFGLTAAATGINEKTAESLGLDYDKVYLFGSNHAGYYPHADDMTIKVLFEKPGGRILGAQLIGKEGTDKRADILAVAIRAQMTASDLATLELCYAPPYSSAKDPVNMVGLMISNLLEGRIAQYHWHDVEGLPRDGSVLLLDVRTPREYESGCIEGFVNIPVDQLRSRLTELDANRPIYLHCHSGLRSYIAARILTQQGFSVSHLAGGIRFYRQAQIALR